MGNSGSYTTKAEIKPCFFVFTKWGSPEMKALLLKSQFELPETFALRKHEFEFLLGTDLVDFNTLRTLFNDIFDLDKNQMVDKFEVLVVICLTSKIDNIEKINFFFDLFNFNDKGYLYDSELALLLLAVSRGVFKADQKYLPPSNKIISMLVQEAFLHAKVDKKSIRKPELVNFALGNPEILSFLESWRGHASQVLLAPDEQWRDLTFPCSTSSIIPSHDWLKLGYPPGNFVKWRRRKKAGNGRGYVDIFTHELSYLKTVDRRIVFTGSGIIGRGSLQQGLLADRWFLNALAAMTGRPDTITACLASTGQEDSGRFCTRMYEGSGWRSVNVDDRVPCSPDGNPLFATSSSATESWPMILEKGLAKYLGSYSHIGMCATRGDATEAGLRLLTGGHVYKLHVKDFEWRSVEDDVRGQSGAAYVKKCISEGTLISFGKSESLALMQQKVGRQATTTNDNTVPPIMQPFGRLFPVVGSVIVKGYNHLILRDPYDLIADCDVDVNYESGHSRTFKIKLEDLPAIYDTMIISRYPDSLRVIAERLYLKPWKSEVISQDTKSVDSPAKFLLSVSKSESNGIRLNPIKKMGDRAANITAVLEESDGKVISELEKVMTLKEKVDFSRVKLDKSSYQAATTASGDGSGKEGESGKGKEKKIDDKVMRRRSTILKRGDDMTDLYEVVDVALTLSSSCDWTFAGSESAGAKIRVRITPTADTLVALKDRDRQIEAIRKQIRDLAEARKLAAIKLELEQAAASQGTGAGDDGDSVTVASVDAGTMENSRNSAGPSGGAHGNSTNALLLSGASAPGDVRKSLDGQATVSGGAAGSYTGTERKAAIDPVLSDKIKYDVILSAERSWVSTSLKLFPGDYYVFADVTFNMPYEDAFKMTMPAHISEAPWLDAKHPANHIHSAKKDSIKSFTRRSSSAIVTNVSPAKSKLVIPSGLGMSGNDLSNPNGGSGGALCDSGLPDLSKMPQIWLQVSSVEKFDVKAIERADLPLGYNASLADINVEPEKWPFSSESQAEASSRALQVMLTKSKKDAQLVGLQFMNLAGQYKEERKKMLLEAKTEVPVLLT